MNGRRSLERTLIPRLCAAVVLATISDVRAENNLIRIGTFEHDKAEVLKETQSGHHGGSFDVFTEDLSWNRCGRLTAGPIIKHAVTGDECIGADIVFCGAGGNGIPVEPDQFYEYSFELRGTMPRASLNIIEYCTENGKRVSRFVEKELRFALVNDWKRFKGRFRTGKNAERIALQFIIWTYADRPGKPARFKPGDSLFIDNLSLVGDENFPKVKALLEKPSEPFRVAPYAVEADASCPFLPVELVNPPEKIVFRAAVNEKKPLPVAIANLTGAFAQYRVALEANAAELKPKRPVFDTGRFGLADYPREKITVREALRFKDTDSRPVTLRLDPLADINGASVISVPPKEAGAVWFDFDTYDVKPGVYRGRLHVIPLFERADYKKNNTAYSQMESAEKVIPVEFTVDPIVLPREPVRPGHWFGLCTSEEDFRLRFDAGTRIFNIKTSAFKADAVGNPQSEVRKAIADHKRWAKKYGVDIKFLLNYNALGASQKNFNPKNDPKLKWPAWEQYVQTVAKVMEESGVPFRDYCVLLKDEAWNSELPELREGQQRLKRLYPQMQTYMTVAPRTEHGEIDYLDYMADTTDMWTTPLSRYMKPGVMDRFNALRAKYGTKVMHYDCQVSPRLSLAGYYRRHCWRGEYLQLDGDMMFRFNTSPNPTYGELAYRVIQYAEVTFTAGGRVIPTVRYMAYREGMTDLKYLQALREKRGNEPAIAAFVKKAAERAVKEDPYSAPLLWELREEIRKRLLEGTGAAAENKGGTGRMRES